MIESEALFKRTIGKKAPGLICIYAADRETRLKTGLRWRWPLFFSHRLIDGNEIMIQGMGGDGSYFNLATYQKTYGAHIIRIALSRLVGI